jgi:hypothetical protein
MVLRKAVLRSLTEYGGLETRVGNSGESPTPPLITVRLKPDTTYETNP